MFPPWTSLRNPINTKELTALKALRWIGVAGLVIWLASCSLSAPSSSSESSNPAPSTPSKGLFDAARTFRNPQAQVLARAAQDNNAGEVRRLIKDEHVNPDALFSDTNDEERVPVVAWPVITQSLGGLKALLDDGANPNVKMRYPDLDKTVVLYYDNAMVYAAMNEDPAYLKLLLEHGGDPNTRNVNGETLLFQAYIWHNQWQNVQMLVERGADANAITQSGSILYDYTAEGNFMAAYWLLQHGADPKANSGIKPAGEEMHYLPVEAIFWYPDKPNMLDWKRKCQQWLFTHGIKRPPMPAVYHNWRRDLGQPYEEKDIPLL
ncbi:ankyrin repeat domain-containing protein [Rhodanobacter sp. L36]|uniref:ankyrin repeat domain-containing protein n=1 Tax=Rhodanobacter sp. L36 TaxID=1747221 RepID=UPI0020B15569|nr:ankyrin repeat domain-containing protein [Rhodanobacter sp. L36]